MLRELPRFSPFSHDTRRELVGSSLSPCSILIALASRQGRLRPDPGGTKVGHIATDGQDFRMLFALSLRSFGVGYH